MITCDIVQDLLPLYADGQASEASRQLIHEHIQQCEGCAAMAKAMCTPMEQEYDPEETACVDILRRQKRRNRNRIILACVLTVILCLTAWWLYMEFHFVEEKLVTVSNSQEDILAEMPQLALTQAEKAFAQELMLISDLRDALKNDGIQILPVESFESDLSPVLPENAVLIEVSVINKNFYVTYQLDNQQVMLEYCDANDDGVMDAVCKTIGVADKTGRNVDTVYQIRYAIVLDWAYYEKIEPQHVWFGFLNMS